MKNMILKKMILENFMMCGYAEIDFSRHTKISARNGSGKSTIVNAYTWLLFNCDYDLNDNPDVRRIVDGIPVDDADVCVTAVFDIDGKEVTARKVQNRKYNKDHTSFSDANTYYINEVPKTLTAFNEYFGDIKILRMCSNINAFLKNKPADMRTILFSYINDEVTDLSVAQKNNDLKELVPLLEKYERDEIEALHKSTKAKISKEIPTMLGRIKEKEHEIAIKEGIDLSALELQKRCIEEQIEKANSDKHKIDELKRQRETIKDRLMHLQFDMNEVERKANEENLNKRTELQKQIYESTIHASELTKKIIDTGSVTSKYSTDISLMEEKLSEFNDRLRIEREKQCDESKLICPTCGREYSEDKKHEIVSVFETRKSAVVSELESKIRSCKEEINSKKMLMDNLEKEMKDLKSKRDDITVNIKSLKSDIDNFPERVDSSGLEEFKRIHSEIDNCREELSDTETKIDELSVLANIHGLQAQLKKCEMEIASVDTTSDEERLEQLKSMRMDLEQQKVDSERILFLLDELDKAKNNDVSDAINSRFGVVKWKLYDMAKNGNYKSVCIPMVDDMPITSILSNKGNRIIGKVDICSSIQKANGINCPIWVDDGESLDTSNKGKLIEMTDSQVIILCVSDDDMKFGGLNES